MIRGEIWQAEFGIPYRSEIGYSRPVIIVAQLYAIDRSRFKNKISKAAKETMEQVEIGMKLVLGMN